MSCDIPKPFYIPNNTKGIKLINSAGDGYTISVNWRRAYPELKDDNVAYNIYFSTKQGNVIKELPKYVSTNSKTLVANLIDFVPGDTYYFVVRATEYDPSWYNINQLPTDPSQCDGYIHIYPETLLAQDIDDTQLNIPITDIDLFPAYGVIQVGYELIRYTSKDIPNGELIASERGFYKTDARSHTTDGYDGYNQLSPIVSFWKGLEEDNLFIIQEQSTFQANKGIYTIPDGYRTLNREGMLTTDLGNNDKDRIDFPRFDFVGWRRTDPELFFSGKCMDSYIGGENFCADGYHGINRQIRNMSFTDHADRLQEMLLEKMGTGEYCVLLKRLYKGTTCRCFTPNMESADPRCGDCFGTGFQGGYEQYYYPRNSSGRILVRFDPATEDLKREEAGLESHLIHNCWTLSSPAIDDGDVIIRFLPDGKEEEFRYVVLDVTRNKILFGQTGNQKFRLQRIRKTSSIYQWHAIRDTSTMPRIIYTTINNVRGPGDVPIPHNHEIVVNEGITTLSQMNQTTKMQWQIKPYHEHVIHNGVVLPALGHTHDIIL